ncbi:heavy-metal-associated domain-containing protein [Cryobacterium sp. Sr8]|uniref:heavy-metal-associated domain-containing protein n=1 Tax=Cryobacterium sp. Sr8 TaxID=1259203 RepID=UPI00141A6A5A|nr:heavy metal-associated domain-containing protein [Cryobacterium sp. Sr8]
MCTTNQNDLGLTDASCACGTHGHAQTSSASANDGLTTSTFEVAGMTCGHCVKSVTEELSQLEGAKNVEVALVSGGVSKVTVSSIGALDPDAVAAAIDEAGYELVTPAR